MSTDAGPHVGTAHPPPAPGRWRRIGPVLALLALAPWAAECSWGGFTAVDSLFVVVVLAPLYGGAAVLVRETARRVGGGWPAIVLLAAAFGVYQAGLVDQSLFNPAFLADTEFAEAGAGAAGTRVPGLGFSAEQAVDFVGNHVALSICAPIAVVESFVGPRRRHRPWLGRWGLLVIVVLFALGSLMIFSDDSAGRKGFLLSPVQATIAALTVLLLVGAALLPRWRRAPRRVAVPAPHPGWVGLVVLGAHLSTVPLSGWARVGWQLLAAAAVAVLVVRWSRRAGWDQRHVLAAWAAGLLVAAALAYVVPNYAPASPTEALVGDVVVTAVVLALTVGAFHRLRRRPPPGEVPEAAADPPSH
ncbi:MULTISPECIES: hypothetical protein [unclassified Micromonospora]|uniref:hypothetical protein n=1 Tax=unclassified Micromonospora TaxID=2617518 RepID=UPI002FEFED53